MKTYFEHINDPRQPWKVKHNLLEIVVMTICAVISGCEHWEDIVDFSRIKALWFKEKLGLVLENGVASHDTFQRVFQLIKPEETETGFLSWVKSVTRKLYFETEDIAEKTVACDKGHGRIETREYFLETEIDWLHQKPYWPGLNGIGMVKSSVWKKGSLREETRYFITHVSMIPISWHRSCFLSFESFMRLPCPKEK